ncbi:hypothetical protein CjjRM3196_0735 [Campylobacter jejuni subsp. jejuni]|uniref:New protein 1 n=1 Tax=Campylobacter jejuni TaxID=197 RepID=E5F1U5_CAMJU|nr:hypothetical protein [Campylobacter jejuni]ALF91773.1 hypothetical protein CjjRM3197_0735 [Campylobacter jejuni subsp. jejuni]EAQ58466.1 hypothetical protein CJJ26094_0479 [Campylobacter jejuni subsp. jejuni 260.94]ADW85733.1 new protein 1 [Campylobacter jejuni]ALF93408.1 hypothetical protein CjjRM3196_0735 [Campylobacter jejuni subsp. jejuni]
MLDKRKIKKGELPTQWDGGFSKSDFGRILFAQSESIKRS